MSGGGGATVALAGARLPEPLTCASQPLWRQFLEDVTASVAAGLFPLEPLAGALAVLEAYNTASPPSAPAAIASFAASVGAAATTHATGGEAFVEDFCVPGYVTACQILARNNVGHVRSHILTLAEKLLFFGATDVLSSSMWPARRGEILANLVAPPEVQRNGTTGEESQEWLSFAHAPVVASDEPFVSPVRGFGPPQLSSAPSSSPSAGPRRRSLRIWLTDQHSVISGELCSTLPRALGRAGYEVRFDRQSVSYYCRFHGVCFTDGRVGRLLRHPRIHEVSHGAGMLDGFQQVERVTRDMDRISREFYHLFRSRLRSVDMFLCSIPIAWCRLYERFRNTPILGVMDQPIFLFVPTAQRISWLEQFRALALHPRNLFVCHTAFLQLQVEWQTGLRLPVVRYLAARTARWRYRPAGGAAGAALVVSMLPYRPYFLPLLRRIQELNPLLNKIRLVGLEEVPSWRSNRPDRYRRLSEHRAAVVFPYDVHFVKFLELYSMGVPIFLPSDFYMWAFSWTIADPSVMEDALAHVLRDDFGAPPWRHPYPPYCGRRSRWHFDPAACAYWAPFSDLARLPHLEYFSSLPDCLVRLHSAEDEALRLRSAGMRAFQARTTAATEDFWRRGIGAVLAGNTSRLLL